MTSPTARLSRPLQDWKQNSGRPLVQVGLVLFRVSQLLRGRPAARPAYILAAAAYRFWALAFLGLDMPVKTAVGPGLTLHHSVGVVIHGDSVLGSNVQVRQGLTLGTRHADGPAPIIGDSTDFGASCIVLGGVTLGDHCKIGAQALVLTDVPPGSMAIGSPAEIR